MDTYLLCSHTWSHKTLGLAFGRLGYLCCVCDVIYKSFIPTIINNLSENVSDTDTVTALVFSAQHFKTFTRAAPAPQLQDDFELSDIGRQHAAKVLCLNNRKQENDPREEL